MSIKSDILRSLNCTDSIKMTWIRYAKVQKGIRPITSPSTFLPPYSNTAMWYAVHLTVQLYCHVRFSTSRCTRLQDFAYKIKKFSGGGTPDPRGVRERPAPRPLQLHQNDIGQICLQDDFQFHLQTLKLRVMIFGLEYFTNKIPRLLKIKIL